MAEPREVQFYDADGKTVWTLGPALGDEGDVELSPDTVAEWYSDVVDEKERADIMPRVVGARYDDGEEIPLEIATLTSCVRLAAGGTDTVCEVFSNVRAKDPDQRADVERQVRDWQNHDGEYVVDWQR